MVEIHLKYISRSGWLPKFNADFLVERYFSGKIFMNIRASSSLYVKLLTDEVTNRQTDTCLVEHTVLSSFIAYSAGALLWCPQCAASRHIVDTATLQRSMLWKWRRKGRCVLLGVCLYCLNCITSVLAYQKSCPYVTICQYPCDATRKRGTCYGNVAG